MAQMFPTLQQFIDLKNTGIDSIGITEVQILTSSDHVFLPNIADAQLLQTDRTTADPTFYISSDQNSFNIDGATVGSVFLIVSRHQGQINLGRGTG